MVIMINGSFGIGKTTVARMLRRALPGSLIYDPEWFGIALMRLGKVFRIRRWETDDFQNIPLWRRSLCAGVRLFGRFASGPVIVPMTFSSREYFDEVLSGLRNQGSQPRVFCLAANLETIERRLASRLNRSENEGNWLARRIRECVEAHRNAHFGESVATENRTARDVADEILNRLRC